MNVQIEVLDTQQALAKLEEEWRKLEAHATDLQLFQCFDWVDSWWQNIGRHGPHQLRVITARIDTKLVSLWPGVLTRKGLVRILESAGGLMTCYDDVLVREDEHRNANLEAMWSAMNQLPGVDLLSLQAVHQNSLLATLDLGGSRSATTAPLVDCASFEDFDSYWAARPNRTRKHQRRTWRMLEREGAIECRVDDDTIAPTQAVAHALEFKKAWIEARGLPTKTITSDRGRQFLQNVCERFGSRTSRARLCLTSLRLDGAVISIGIGMRFHGRHYEYLGAYDPRYGTQGAGRARMEDTIKHCFATKMHAYDMQTPTTPFKAIWTDRDATVRQHLIARTMRGRLYKSIYHGWLRPRLKSTYTALPPLLRRTLGRFTGGA